VSLTHSVDTDSGGRLRLTLENHGDAPADLGSVEFAMRHPKPVPMPGMERFGAEIRAERIEMNRTDVPDPSPGKQAFEMKGGTFRPASRNTPP
jgi:hypothetical protein